MRRSVLIKGDTVELSEVIHGLEKVARENVFSLSQNSLELATLPNGGAEPTEHIPFPQA